MNCPRVLTGLFCLFLCLSVFRFDPDKEIESLEKKEEEEKKKKQEKSRAINKNAVPANLDLKGKCALGTSHSETKLMRILAQELAGCLSVCLSLYRSVFLSIYLSGHLAFC